MADLSIHFEAVEREGKGKEGIENEKKGTFSNKLLVTALVIYMQINETTYCRSLLGRQMNTMLKRAHEPHISVSYALYVEYM